MEKFNRAIRRHHAKRLKKARCKYWGVYRNFKEMSEIELGRFFGKVLNAPCACSCWMCNRPRKRFGKPFAEIRMQQVELHLDKGE